MPNWPENIFVLIPSYKSSALLSEFLPELKNYVPAENICIVDDASKDNTDVVCAQHNVQYLCHQINKGKGAALDTGFKYLLNKNARWIVTMDADGQHAPEDLHNFIDSIEKDPSIGICIGKRCMKPGVMPLLRICSNKITSAILSVFAGIVVKDSQCGYRIYSSILLKKISIQFNRFEMESEVILKASALKFGISFIQVQTLYFNDLSHISHFKDTFRWIKAVLRVWFTIRKQKLLKNEH